MKKLLSFALLLLAASAALAQTYPSPTFQNATVIGTLTAPAPTFTTPLPVASGGTGSATASGTALDNISGFASTGFMSRTGAGAYSFTASTGSGSVVLGTSPTIATPTVTGSFTATGLVTLADHATQAANTIIGNGTGLTSSPTALPVPSCSTSASALNWTSGTGLTCNTSINAATLGGATFAAPGPIGSTTASTGAFTTLSASSAVSGTGFSTYFASPPAIGSTTPNTGNFTSSTITGAAGTFRLSNFLTSGSNRWVIFADSTAESGSNAGSNFGVNAYSDAGAYLSSPIAINRATGVLTFAPLTPAFTGSTIYDGSRTILNGFPVGAEFGGNTVGVYDALVGGVEIPSSATGNMGAGVAGYSRTASTVTNAVGVYGQGTMNMSGASVGNAWGGNVLVSNCANQSCAALSGFNGNIYGFEIDLNLATISGGGAPSGNARGIYINGIMNTTPSSNFNAIEVDHAGSAPWGNGIKFDTGCCTNAISSPALTVTSKIPIVTPQTFASLPACNGATGGGVATVTDSNTNVWGAAIAGGGANVVMAFCDSGSWTVVGK